MAQLNYHHLRYFREVATEGHLGRAAARLNVSQSALSLQIKQLEDRMGHAFFDRVGRSLVLTEAGRIALDHAEQIFSSGDALVATLQQRSSLAAPLRVGALSTLSRNFQMQFLRPMLATGADGTGAYGIVLRSGNTRVLMDDLQQQALDVVLTTEVPPNATGLRFAAKRMSQQQVGLHGRADLLGYDTLADLLSHAPLILPTESTLRAEFENLTAQLGVQPVIAASVDDMAMVRLLAREGAGVALAPAVVVADEIAAGTVVTAPFDLGLVEPFFAVTLPRKFPHPALAALLAAESPIATR